MLKLAIVTDADEMLSDAVWIDLPEVADGDFEQHLLTKIYELWSWAEGK